MTSRVMHMFESGTFGKKKQEKLHTCDVYVLDVNLQLVGNVLKIGWNIH